MEGGDEGNKCLRKWSNSGVRVLRVGSVKWLRRSLSVKSITGQRNIDVRLPPVEEMHSS